MCHYPNGNMLFCSFTVEICYSLYYGHCKVKEIKYHFENICIYLFMCLMQRSKDILLLRGFDIKYVNYT